MGIKQAELVRFTFKELITESPGGIEAVFHWEHFTVGGIHQNLFGVFVAVDMLC